MLQAASVVAIFWTIESFQKVIKGKAPIQRTAISETEGHIPFCSYGLATKFLSSTVTAYYLRNEKVAEITLSIVTMFSRADYRHAVRCCCKHAFISSFLWLFHSPSNPEALYPQCFDKRKISPFMDILKSTLWKRLQHQAYHFCWNGINTPLLKEQNWKNINILDLWHHNNEKGN